MQWCFFLTFFPDLHVKTENTLYLNNQGTHSFIPVLELPLRQGIISNRMKS